MGKWKTNALIFMVGLCALLLGGYYLLPMAGITSDEKTRLEPMAEKHQEDLQESGLNRRTSPPLPSRSRSLEARVDIAPLRSMSNKNTPEPGLLTGPTGHGQRTPPSIVLPNPKLSSSIKEPSAGLDLNAQLLKNSERAKTYPATQNKTHAIIKPDIIDNVQKFNEVPRIHPINKKKLSKITLPGNHQIEESNIKRSRSAQNDLALGVKSKLRGQPSIQIQAHSPATLLAKSRALSGQQDLNSLNMHVSPASLTVNALSTESVTRTLTISNSGDQNLSFSISNCMNRGASALKAGAVRRSFFTPTYPRGLAYDGSHLLVAKTIYRTSSTLYRIDTRNGAPRGELDVMGLSTSLGGLAWDGAKVWVATQRSKVIAVDRVTGNEVASFPSANGEQVTGVAVGGGALWALHGSSRDEKIYKMSLVDGSVLDSFLVPSGVSGPVYNLTYFNGALWTGSYNGNGTIYKIDPGSGAILASFRGPEERIRGISQDGEGNLWVVGFSTYIAYLVDSGEEKWLSESTPWGTVPPNGSVDVSVRFDGVLAGAGTHSATIAVHSNDPSEAAAQIPVIFTVSELNPDTKPVAQDDTATTDEDTAVSINVLANDTDPAGGALTITALSQPLNGTVSINGKFLIYTPHAHYNGSETFSYTIGNQSGGHSVASVYVVVRMVNDNPVLEGLPTASPNPAQVDKAVSFFASATDPDAIYSFYVLSYTWNFGDGGTGKGSTPLHTFTAAGNYLVSVTVSDGKGGTDTEEVMVKVSDALAVDDTIPSTTTYGHNVPGGIPKYDGLTYNLPGQVGDATLTFDLWNMEWASTAPDHEIEFEINGHGITPEYATAINAWQTGLKLLIPDAWINDTGDNMVKVIHIQNTAADKGLEWGIRDLSATFGDLPNPGSTVTIAASKNGSAVAQGSVVSGVVEVKVTISNGLGEHAQFYGNFVTIPTNEPGHMVNSNPWVRTMTVDTALFLDGENLFSVHSHPMNQPGQAYQTKFSVGTFKLVTANDNPASNGDTQLPTLEVQEFTIGSGLIRLKAKVIDDGPDANLPISKKSVTHPNGQIICHLGSSVLGRSRWSQEEYSDDLNVVKTTYSNFQHETPKSARMVIFFSDTAGRANYAFKEFTVPALGDSPHRDLFPLPIMDAKIMNLKQGDEILVPEGGAFQLDVKVSNIVRNYSPGINLATWIGNKLVSEIPLDPIIQALDLSTSEFVVQVPLSSVFVSSLLAGRNQDNPGATAFAIWNDLDISPKTVPISSLSITTSTHIHLNSIRIVSAPDPNQPPLFDTVPTASPNPALENETVMFSASASDPDAGDSLSYTWQFGDGGTGTGPTPSHTFAAGSYTASVTVSDGQGGTATATISITVNPKPNLPPTAAFTATPTTGMAPLSVQFNASSSSDDSGISSYGWDFGDGSNGSGATLSHNFVDAGEYMVTLTVTDGEGKSDTMTQVITAEGNSDPYFNSSPMATPNPAEVGQAITFQVSATDDDNDSLTYTWNFGDGSGGSGVAPVHAYAAAGDYNAWVTVTDGKGGSVSDSVTVTVENVVVAPNITTQPTSKTVTEGQTATFSLSATGSAPLAYQWRKNGTNISGATNASYTTPATAMADDGAKFSVVVSNAVSNVTSNDATLTVIAVPTLTITASAGTDGTITPSGGVTVSSGAAQTFTFVANTGYQVANVLVDGVSVGALASYTFSNVTANHTIHVVFLDSVVEFVIVGDPGNQPYVSNQGTAGRVDYIYRMGKYEITQAQYLVFLNAVDPSGANVLNLYNPLHDRNEFKVDVNSPQGQRYALINNTPQVALATINWYAAARYCNWLHNAQGGPGSTEGDAAMGAYDTRNFDDTNLDTDPLTHNEGAKYWLPTKDEWFKAAYYKGGGTNAGYWRNPYRSDAEPRGEFPPGGSNSENAINRKDPRPPFPFRALAVGSYVNAVGPYGTFDMGGNVNEWTEFPAFDSNGKLSYRRICGGAFFWFTDHASTYATLAFGTHERSPTRDAGFRIAASAPVHQNPPTIDSGPTATPNPAEIGQTVAFHVGATDADNDILTYTWTFGDGTVGNGTDPSHPYNTAGTFTVNVTVTDGNGGSVSASVTVTVENVVVAPSITTQPANKTVTEGQTATFSLSATGSAPLAYQWRKNGTNISGATNASYTTPATAMADDGAKFSVVVSNSAGNVVSTDATLTVIATGGPLAWWKKNETSGATAADSSGYGHHGTLVNGPVWTSGKLAGALSFDGTNDYVEVPDSDALSFGNGSTDTPFSLSAWVKMNDAFGFSIVSKSSDTAAGQKLEYLFSTSSSDGKMFFKLYDLSGGLGIYRKSDVALTSYEGQWIHMAATYDGSGSQNGLKLYLNGGELSSTGTLQNSYTAMHNESGTIKIGSFLPKDDTWSSFADGAIDNVQIHNRQLSAAEITDLANEGATAPTITTQPANQTVTEGQTATLSVTATGTAPLSYQWRRNGTNISGATNASYTTPPAVMADDGAKFNVVVSNAVGNVTSNDATLTVNAVPTFTITASAGADGTITPSGGVTVNSGAAQTFTFAANPGYQVADVLVDGVSIGAVASHTFSNVTANHTIHVVFLDSEAPQLDVTTVVLKGNVSDASGIASLKVNGTAVPVNQDGAWQHEVMLGSESTLVVLEVKDTVGKLTTKTMTIIK